MMAMQLDLFDWLATQNKVASPTVDPVVLYRIDPAHHMRYYVLRIERTLFGDWAVVGSHWQQRGQQRSALCTNQDEAHAVLQRQRRSYG